MARCIMFVSALSDLSYVLTVQISALGIGSHALAINVLIFANTK